MIPTENLKFNKFMDLLFNSKMEKTDMKDEITKYVQLLETNYNQTVRDLKNTLDREKNKVKK
jgi:predicted transcriptional regulator